MSRTCMLRIHCRRDEQLSSKSSTLMIQIGCWYAYYDRASCSNDSLRATEHRALMNRFCANETDKTVICAKVRYDFEEDNYA